MNCHFVGVKVRHLYISPGHNFFGHHEKPPGKNLTMEVDKIECIAGRGIRGDRFFDFKENYNGQVTFFFTGNFLRDVCRIETTGKIAGRIAAKRHC